MEASFRWNDEQVREPVVTDPIITKTLRNAVGLRAGGTFTPHDVLATYTNKHDEEVFALCRNGVLLREKKGWRYIDNSQIADVDIDIRLKTVPELRKVSLALDNGDVVQLPVDGERNGMLDVFPIYNFIRRRVIQRRAFGW